MSKQLQMQRVQPRSELARFLGVHPPIGQRVALPMVLNILASLCTLGATVVTVVTVAPVATLRTMWTLRALRTLRTLRSGRPVASARTGSASVSALHLEKAHGVRVSARGRRRVGGVRVRVRCVASGGGAALRCVARRCYEAERVGGCQRVHHSGLTWCMRLHL